MSIEKRNKKDLDDNEHFKEMKKLFKMYIDSSYIIPINIRINITTDLIMTQITMDYTDMTKKHKKPIDSMYNHFHNMPSMDRNKGKSVHIAYIKSPGNKNVMATNDYSRTYLCNKSITSLHAEHSAINAYQKKYKKQIPNNSTLYVLRYTRDGHMCNSKPCNHCASLILDCNIRTVVYSTGNNTFHLCRIK